MRDDARNMLAARSGHFLLESGHHGDLWLDLELLCLKPRLIRLLAAELATRLLPLEVEVVCGPLVEGAFVALLVGMEMDVEFTYSERFSRPAESGLFSAGYRLPDSLRGSVRGRRVAIVNDVINAGSAVRGTFEDLENCGATVVALGTLLTLGTAAAEFAVRKGVALESLTTLPNNLWTPETCPLCASNVPLEDVAGFWAD
jgi:orotate phosphoribosyltransferase